jgi:hypothetical protein
MSSFRTGLLTISLLLLRHDPILTNTPRYQYHQAKRRLRSAQKEREDWHRMCVIIVHFKFYSDWLRLARKVFPAWSSSSNVVQATQSEMTYTSAFPRISSNLLLRCFSRAFNLSPGVPYSSPWSISKAWQSLKNCSRSLTRVLDVCGSFDPRLRAR